MPDYRSWPTAFSSPPPIRVLSRPSCTPRSPTSPIGALLRPAAHVAVLVGLLIALAEVAVGLGTLFGLFSKVAAAGGMALSLHLVPVGQFQHDALLLRVRHRLLLRLDARLSSRGLVRGRSTAPSRDAVPPSGPRQSRAGAKHHRARPPRRPAQAWPYDRARQASPSSPAGIVAAVGRMFAGSSPTTSGVQTLSPPTTTGGGTTTTQAEGPAPPRAPRSALPATCPVGGARAFTDPAQGIPAYVVQPTKGNFVAFSAVCTHMGCTIGFYQPALQFRCPCHGSVFSATTGAVIQGPATLPLPGVSVKEFGGKLLADG